MSDKTSIEWTDATWNPVTGCTEVTPGCDNCYAKTFAERWRGTAGHYFENGFDVQLRPEKLDQPLRWKRPRRIFVNSMSDLFHDGVPGDYIIDVFAVMAMAKQHTFQLLTKRHGRMRSLLNDPLFVEELATRLEIMNYPDVETTAWPLPNVWLGVSAEDQKRADLRIPALLETPAVVRFVSAEPLLGPINLYHSSHCPTHDFPGGMCTFSCPERRRVNWVIVGGESGRGARPMHPDWARGLRNQCETAGVAFLFKQRGEWTWNEPDEFRMPSRPYTDRVAVMHGGGMTAMTKGNHFNPFERGHPFWATRIERVGKKAAGRDLDGRTWDQYPEEAVTE